MAYRRITTRGNFATELPKISPGSEPYRALNVWPRRVLPGTARFLLPTFFLPRKSAVHAETFEQLPSWRTSMPILLWLLGIPIPIIILLLLFFH
jgi:hypothetical protein